MEKIKQLQCHKAWLKQRKCTIITATDNYKQNIEAIQRRKQYDEMTYSNCVTLLNNADKVVEEAQELLRKSEESRRWLVIKGGAAWGAMALIGLPLFGLAAINPFFIHSYSAIDKNLTEARKRLEEAYANVNRIKEKMEALSVSIGVSVKEIDSLTKTVQGHERQVWSVQGQIEQTEHQLILLRQRMLYGF